MATYSFNGDAISGSVSIDNPYAPVSLVTDRFNQTLAQAQEVLELLIGSEGDGGLIGEMDDALTAAPPVDITVPVIDTDLVLENSGQTVPVFDSNELVSIPNETYDDPVMEALPSIDTSFSDITEPADIMLSMAWAEAALPTEVFTALRTQILADLVDGSTGITADVEAAIYTRARNRQQADRLAAYNRINNTALQMQHDLPAGVLVSALADFEIGANRQDAEIEAAIIEGQAKLAQENSKSAMQQANALEQLIRQTRTDESGRALEAAKSLAQLTIQEFSERVRKLVAIWEGRKVKVQAQAEALKGVIESNKGLIDIYKAQYDALKSRIDGATAFNKGLTDVYAAEVQGFSEAERAIAARNDSAIKLIEQDIAAADLTVRAQIAEAQSLISGYSSEQSIRERVSADRAQIASHVAASLLSAVSASASLGYSGQESSSKGYHLQVQGSETHSYQEV